VILAEVPGVAGGILQPIKIKVKKKLDFEKIKTF